MNDAAEMERLLVELRAHVENWQEDRRYGLLPTEGSLASTITKIDAALRSIRS